jgi:hypothetical protein
MSTLLSGFGNKVWIIRRDGVEDKLVFRTLKRKFIKLSSRGNCVDMVLDCIAFTYVISPLLLFTTSFIKAWLNIYLSVNELSCSPELPVR